MHRSYFDSSRSIAQEQRVSTCLGVRGGLTGLVSGLARVPGGVTSLGAKAWGLVLPRGCLFCERLRAQTNAFPRWRSEPFGSLPGQSIASGHISRAHYPASADGYR